MTSSDDLYNPSTDRWTHAGKVYFKKILNANPKTSKQEKEEIMALTGVSKKKCQ
jgi:hypothetical protein